MVGHLSIDSSFLSILLSHGKQQACMNLYHAHPTELFVSYCPYLHEALLLPRKMSFYESHSLSSCSPGRLTYISCYGFRVRVVTILKTSSLIAIRAWKKTDNGLIFWEVFTNPKYLKNKSIDDTFRVKCNPVLRCPCFENSILSFSF